MYIHDEAEKLAQEWKRHSLKALEAVMHLPQIHLAALIAETFDVLRREAIHPEDPAKALRFMDDLSLLYEESDHCAYKDDEEYFASIYGECE